MRDVVIKTENLTKRYRSFTALENMNMTVYKGDIYGLIGKNGAGKTTIMKLLTGLTGCTNGEFELFGKRGAAAKNEKRRIGCLIENPAFFGNLTAYQNLNYYTMQKGIADKAQIDVVLSLVGLSEVRNKKFRKFSLGMKQRLGIAFALLDNPDLVILDEPINGLDPIGISELRDTFRTLNEERGITFIISSHILSELYLTANRFLFLDHGRALKELTKEQLDLACMRCIALRTNDIPKTAAVIERKLDIRDYKVIDGTELRIYQRNVSPEALNSVLYENGIGVQSVFETGVSLEDYFKSLVGEVES